MKKLIGLIVAVLGILCLVAGVFFIVQAGSARDEIIDTVAEEGFPVLASSTMYPYLGASETEIIDTADEIEDAADVLNEARHAMAAAPVGYAGFLGLFSPTPADGVPALTGASTLKFHEYSGVLAFETTMNSAQMGLAVADSIKFNGIIYIVLGVALFLAGVGIVAVSNDD